MQNLLDRNARRKFYIFYLHDLNFKGLNKINYFSHI